VQSSVVVNPTRSRVLRASVLAILGLAAAAPAAYAQTAPGGASGGGGLEEIVVTASRREESLSRVPISVTALTQDSIDVRGVKDIQDVARFTPGLQIDNSGTNNISIRGIASSAGSGTTGIYIDDTPIQMRALGFNPDETLPKAFDIERVEVLRGPQGTLFGAGSEGGTVRYITTQPSLTKFSVYSRSEVSTTSGGDASYEAGAAVGGPVIDGKLGVRLTAWFRHDGGWIDRIDPTTLATVDKGANRANTSLLRLAAVWAPVDNWTVTPSIYFQNERKGDVSIYWPLYSNPSSNKYVSANPTRRDQPDRFYLPSLKVEGDLGKVKFISNTSYYNRRNVTGYDGTLYNLGFYQSLLGLSGSGLLLDGNGIHLPDGLTNYRAPASVSNDQQNFVQEFRLQSSDPSARFVWTAGLFYSKNKQQYFEVINDPLADNFFQQLAGSSVADYFAGCPVALATDGSCPTDLVPVPLLPDGASYHLKTAAQDEQIAAYGEGTYSLTEQWKVTIGARFSKTKYSINSVTEGPQLFVPGPQTITSSKTENSFTPKLSVQYQHDLDNLFYFTYAKGFRPGGGNNPIPAAACQADFDNFHITSAPATFDSDTVHSYELGGKNSFGGRLRLASSVYYIKWKNIQQSVVPPICQISWVSNLGEAEVKGGDIQAEVLLTQGLTLELAAGYTDARYTKDSKISPDANPVVVKGDSIVGQSGQPPATWSGSLGVEYKFPVGAHDAFVRADYEYQGKAKYFGASQDPNSVQYDSANFTLPATSYLSGRAGMSFGNWTVAAFIDNLTDEHKITNYNWTIDPGTGDTRLLRQFSFRPRTYGLTLTYRQ
jgi:outer membrane receptor protein involved in Fe transport